MTNRMGPAGPQSASQLKSSQRILFFVSTSRIFWHLHPEEPWLVELKASVQNGSAFGVCRLWLSLGTSRADAVGPGRPLSCPPNSQVEKRRPRNGGGGLPEWLERPGSATSGCPQSFAPGAVGNQAPLTPGEGFQSLAVGRFVWPLMTDMTAVHEAPRCRKLRTELRVVSKQNLRVGYICILFWVTGCRLLSATEEG